MSAAKRRVARKIARLVRMDLDHYICQRRWYRDGMYRTVKAARILANMRAIGLTMNARMQQRATEAINNQRAAMGRENLR